MGEDSFILVLPKEAMVQVVCVEVVEKKGEELEEKEEEDEKEKNEEKVEEEEGGSWWGRRRKRMVEGRSYQRSGWGNTFTFTQLQVLTGQASLGL